MDFSIYYFYILVKQKIEKTIKQKKTKIIVILQIQILICIQMVRKVQQQIFIIILVGCNSYQILFKQQKLWRRIFYLKMLWCFYIIHNLKQMKIFIILLMLMLFYANASYVTSVNYISNPDFSQPKLPSGQFNSFATAGAWSEVTNKIEIGDAKIWNKRWPSGQLCDLSSDRLSTIYQTINLNEGSYQLSITWAANQFVTPASSKWSLYWNDVLIKSFVGTDYEIHKETLIVKANQGANKISLKGQSGSPFYGAGIKLVELYGQAKPVVSYDTSVNYISNADFSQPKLSSGQFNSFATAGAWSEVTNKIEIGDAKIWNKRWPSGQLCDLSSDRLSTIYQTINLNEGSYQLSITWAANQFVTPASSKWSLYWNDVLIKSFVGTDYEIHKETLIVKANQGANKISLKGQSGSPFYGAGIKLVELYGQAKPVVSYDTSVNYISNADFSQPKLSSGQFNSFATAGAWSEVTNKIEIGDAKIWNKRWPSGQLCDLTSDRRSTIYQTINLNEGSYQLSITWAANQFVTPASSKWSLYWNDVLIKSFVGTDYEIHKETLIVKANQGANKISLKSESDSLSYGPGIKLVELYGSAKPKPASGPSNSPIISRKVIKKIESGQTQPVLTYDTSVNYILNPDFSQPKLVRGQYNTFKKAGDWFEVTHRIEIGDAKIWNKRWPSGQLCDLTSDRRSTIYQTINLNEGSYQLSITWAANQFVNFASSKWSLYWNDVLIKSFVGTDYEIHKETLIVKANQGANKISLKSESDSLSYGPGIKLVELYGSAKPKPASGPSNSPIISRKVIKKIESGQTRPVVSYDTSVNYILNSDFSQPKLSSGQFNSFATAGAWSEVTNKIEIGDAKIWNKRWPSGQLCDLSSDRLSTIYQTINLNEGSYQLSITWAANQFVTPASSKWSLYWNGVLIKSFVGTDYEIHKETLIVKANQGANKISLKGQSGSPFYGAGIKLVELYGQAKPVVSYDTSVNYISNADFSQPKLSSGQFNSFATAGAWSEVTNKIEIGDAKIWNKRWPSGQLCDLTSDRRSTIYQTINLNEGSYQLSITWAANQFVTPASSKWSLYWNDVLIKSFVGTDYEIHKETLIVKANQGANKISLKSESDSLSYGPGIKLVELYGSAKPKPASGPSNSPIISKKIIKKIESGQTQPVVSYDTSVNYILNPDFSSPKVKGNFIIGQSAGAWSEVNKLIEVGRGTFYNSRFTSGQVCELAAHYNSNIYQTINLDVGYYQLSITWAAKQNATLLTSQFSVYWNDVLVQKFTPLDYDIHKQTLILKANQGANKLSLRGEGINDFMGAAIKLIQLFGQNYIKNGNFETPDTRGRWRILKSAGQWSSYTNQIEIGAGKIYNSVWKTGQIVEIDAKKNSQLYQIVSIPSGNYHLRFDWAARPRVPLASNGFSVWWNGDRLALTTATDYSLHVFTADVVANDKKDNILLIKGEGTSDGLGVGIDNVRLWTAI